MTRDALLPCADFEATLRHMRTAYTACADRYGHARNPRFDAFAEEVRAGFVAEVLASGGGRCVVDVGSGPGGDGLHFANAGLRPWCVDISPGMVERCRAQGLDAVELDFRHLGRLGRRFAGAWMSFSLLHVPKAQAGMVLEQVHRVLERGGVLAVLLFEGAGEGVRDADFDRFGVARYFAYYHKLELEQLLARWFTGASWRRLDISPRPTMAVICTRRDPPLSD